jgi:hypothetical protein
MPSGFGFQGLLNGFDFPAGNIALIEIQQCNRYNR